MVFEKIQEVIVDQLGVNADEVKIDTTFEELGADSLDLFQVVIELEEAFNIQLENVENLKSVNDAVKYVESKM